ncbi:MAG: hypothetical protein PHR45_08360 [Muribaculaceae bacterium]|nr:hypothetical protein [Muribaculaceae bacterium]
MKKFALLICFLMPALSAFAYYDYYSSSSDSLSRFELFTLLVMIAYIILSFIILVRWWKMTTDVKKLREYVTYSNPQLTYLVTIGEKEQAQKDALKMMVDMLYPVYYDYSKIDTKAAYMNSLIEEVMPKLKRLDLTVPEYVTSGEKFIDYINKLTDNKFEYGSDSTKNELY